MAEQQTTFISRRGFALSAVFTAPVMYVASTIPGAYAVTGTGRDTPGNLTVEVADPPIDWDTWDLDYSVPVYRGINSNSVEFTGAFPQTITVTNTGTTPVSNATGTVTFTMRDYGTNLGYWQDRVAATQSNDMVSWERLSNSVETGGSMFAYSYAGTLQPGESFEIPLRYYVPSWTFANVAFNLLVQATVNDDVTGDDDLSEKLGRSGEGYIA